MAKIDSIGKAKVVEDVDALEVQITEITQKIKDAQESLASITDSIEQMTIEKYRLEGEHRAISRLRSIMEPVAEVKEGTIK